LLLEQIYVQGDSACVVARKGGRTLAQAQKSYTFISYTFLHYTTKSRLSESLTLLKFIFVL